MSDIDAVIARVRVEIEDGLPCESSATIEALINHIDAQAAEIAALLAVRDRAAELNNRYVAENVDLRARVEALTAALTDIMQDIANYGVPPRETQERARAALAGKE